MPQSKHPNCVCSDQYFNFNLCNIVNNFILSLCPCYSIWCKYYYFNFTDRDIKERSVMFQRSLNINNEKCISMRPLTTWYTGIKEGHQTMKVSLSCWHGEEAPNENTSIRSSIRPLYYCFSNCISTLLIESQTLRIKWIKETFLNIFYFISGCY